MAATKRSGAADRAVWGYHWKPSDKNDESNGMLTTLWADLRRKPLPKSEPSDVESWYEDEQAERKAFSARIGRAHNIDADRRENWRRRYWN
ncbi:MAG TPA: hypothetical protein VHM89_09100 [Acidimicrobiales bacterium]|nr:hypothetical protein [Acidimicrobiales bacterium]